MHFSNRRAAAPLWFAALLALLLAALLATPAEARRHHGLRHAIVPALRGTGLGHPGLARAGLRPRAMVRMAGPPTDPDKDAALVIDGTTGKVLYARNENAERHPASLTKMMTLYLLFDALKHGQVTMETQMPVSYHAAIQKPTKLGLRPGSTIAVDLAIRSLVIRSANDSAVVIAEALGGTEAHFAEMMTTRAKQLGMRETYYHNANGLPDPLQITTASDLSILARHLAYDFPQYFPYFGLSGFNYKGVWYPTHDNLIGRYQGADGIKTGYTGASGFNLVSSVVRDGHHIIGVVMGGKTAVRRDLEMVRILDNTFGQISTNPTLVARANTPWLTAQPGGPTPVVAGFTLLPQVSNQLASMAALPSSPAAHDADEDTAEAARAPDEGVAVIHAEGPAVPQVSALVADNKQPAPNKPAPLPPAAQPPLVAVAARKAMKPIPAIRPTPRPEVAVASSAPTPSRAAGVQVAGVQVAGVQVASNVPRPHLRPSTGAAPIETGEGDADSGPAPTPGHNWTIQIGAYADQNLAKAQLASYAHKAMDVLGQAGRIVAPAQGSDGHMIYRARFGLFAEREARDVCNRLTQRGQTCFAAVATR